MERERAERIAAKLTADGFHVTAEDVQEFERTGSLYESTIGPDYDDARDSALEDAIEEVQ